MFSKRDRLGRLERVKTLTSELENELQRALGEGLEQMDAVDLGWLVMSLYDAIEKLRRANLERTLRAERRAHLEHNLRETIEKTSEDVQKAVVEHVRHSAMRAFSDPRWNPPTGGQSRDKEDTQGAG
jgi:hypothetical protein